MTADAFIDGPLISCAKARPLLFFSEVMPMILGALRDKAARKGGFTAQRALPAIEAAMRAGFRALYSNGADASGEGTLNLHLFASFPA